MTDAPSTGEARGFPSSRPRAGSRNGELGFEKACRGGATHREPKRAILFRREGSPFGQLHRSSTCCGATTGVLKYGGGDYPMEPGRKPRPGTERTEGGYIGTQRDSRRKRKRLPAYWPPLTWPPGHHSQGSTP